MNILDAINSGKPIRRSHWEQDKYIFDIYSSGAIHTTFAWTDDEVIRPFSKQDILALDWEI